MEPNGAVVGISVDYGTLYLPSWSGWGGRVLSLHKYSLDTGLILNPVAP